MARAALKSAAAADEDILNVPASANLVEWYFEQGWTDGLPVVLILLGVLVTLCNNLMSFSFHSYRRKGTDD